MAEVLFTAKHIQDLICLSCRRTAVFSSLQTVCSHHTGPERQKWTQKHPVHQCPWSRREETPSTVIQAPPTLLLLGDSPIQTGILGTGDFTGWLVACCLVMKDGRPAETGACQPRGGWEELPGSNYWTEQCHILTKEQAAYHTRATGLEGVLRLSVRVSRDMHDASGLQKCISRSFPGHLEKSAGGCWERWIHLRYHFHSKHLEKLFLKPCKQGVHHIGQEIISQDDLFRHSPEQGRGSTVSLRNTGNL